MPSAPSEVYPPKAEGKAHGTLISGNRTQTRFKINSFSGPGCDITYILAKVAFLVINGILCVCRLAVNLFHVLMAQ